MMDAKKICFVSLHAYPVVEPEAPGIFGGTETRAITFALGMQRYTDAEIQVLVRNPTLKTHRMLRGIEFIPWRNYWTEMRAHVAESLHGGKPWYRTRLQKWSWHLLWEMPLLLLTYPWQKIQRNPRRRLKIFDTLGADLWLTFGVHSVSASVIANAHRLGKRCILFTGSDMDLDARYTADSSYRTIYGERAQTCYYALMQADLIVVQNEYQQQMLQERFGRASLLIPNPLDFPEWQASGERDISRYQIPFENYILWVGRAENYHKRVDLALQVARDLPDENFVWIMNPRDPLVEQQIREQKPDNVFIISSVPFRDMGAIFRHAKLFINTSAQEYEGFPNTFLQAAASGVPVCSLEVGESFLQNEGIGRWAGGDWTEFLNGIRKSLQTNREGAVPVPALWDHYDLEKAIQRILQALEEN